MVEKCLTRAEVAERYQISEEEVAEFEAAHRIPVLRFGLAVRYDANALAAFETAARRPAGAEARQPPPEPSGAAPPASLPVQKAERPSLFGLAEAIDRIGCGRNFLLGHLASHPLHAGQPTHRRVGRTIMFTEADFGRLLETFSEEPRQRAVKQAMSTSPLARRVYERALKLAQEGAQRGRAKPKAR